MAAHGKQQSHIRTNIMLKNVCPCKFNTLRPRQNDRHFADDIFKPIFFNEYIRISIKISLKFVPKVPINNIPALVQIMAWRRSGDKSLSEPMMISLLTHICVTRPQWVKKLPGLIYKSVSKCCRRPDCEQNFFPVIRKHTTDHFEISSGNYMLILTVRWNS